jgi:hypothetical protein
LIFFFLPHYRGGIQAYTYATLILHNKTQSKHNRHYMGFDILTVVFMKIHVFWDVMVYQMVNSYTLFTTNSELHLRSSELSLKKCYVFFSIVWYGYKFIYFYCTGQGSEIFVKSSRFCLDLCKLEKNSKLQKKFNVYLVPCSYSLCHRGMMLKIHTFLSITVDGTGYHPICSDGWGCMTLAINRRFPIAYGINSDYRSFVLITNCTASTLWCKIMKQIIRNGVAFYGP